jgi:hypothetical protein
MKNVVEMDVEGSILMLTTGHTRTVRIYFQPNQGMSATQASPIVKPATQTITL